MNNNTIFHGSDLEKIASHFHINQESIINFAVNVNPLGVSSTLKNTLSKKLDIISSYPDRNYISLRNILAKYCSSVPENIIVGNGSTELISLLISNIKAKSALLLGPTYSEYERELQLINCTLDEYRLSAIDDFQLHIEDLFQHLSNGFDFLIMCNPNNPTGKALTTNQLRQILDYCLSRNIFVMIDETYIEFSSDIETFSAVPLTANYTNLMVLRGVSKFFAAPGLRMGYGITRNKQLLEHLALHQNPWSLNSIAALAGEILFTDLEYINTSRDLITQERSNFYDFFNTCKHYKVFSSEANFILVQLCHPQMTANDFFVHCIKNSLMIRNCDSFFENDGEFVRFCFMLPEDNAQLIKSFTTYHNLFI